MLTNQFNKALKRYELDPSEKHKKQYWKSRERLINQFIHKYEFDVVKRFDKPVLDEEGNPVLNEQGEPLKEELYAFDNNTKDVVSFNISLIHADLHNNVPKGKVFDYLDYWLEHKEEPYVMAYLDYLKYNGVIK